jgi:hypothetical protein
MQAGLLWAGFHGRDRWQCGRLLFDADASMPSHNPNPGVLVREFDLCQTIFGHHGSELPDLFGIGRNSGHLHVSG